MSLEIKKYSGQNVSRFRTRHTVDFYADITSADDAIEAFAFAKNFNLKPFVLGAGSNVFFKNKKIKSFVLKNAVEQKIEYLGNDKFEVTSSVMMLDLLKFLYKDNRDASYYLASAPCEVGGAIAMNAGTGPKEAKAIFDFIESVKFVRNGQIFELPADKIEHSHRHTELSTNAFILSAKFCFPRTIFEADPIKARLDWAVKNQDLSVPNCGSLCNKYNARIMRFTRAIFRPFPAGMSQKKLNWTYNKADNPIYLRAFLGTLKFLHKLFRQKLKFEIKMID